MTQLATFYIGDDRYAFDILLTREIGRIQDLNPVPESADYIVGLMNLRGQILTLMDPHYLLDQDSKTPLKDQTLIIMKTEAELEILRRTNEEVEASVGGQDPMALVVDRIGDVLNIHPEDVLPVPPNITGRKRDYVSGVIQLKDQIVTLIAMGKLVKKFLEHSQED